MITPTERPYPTVTCTTCGDWMEVKRDGRGFPPDIAKRKLTKRCAGHGCECTPEYRAGFALNLFRAEVKPRVNPWDDTP